MHPSVGELRLAYETLELPDANDQRLVVYLAAVDATSPRSITSPGVNPARCAR